MYEYQYQISTLILFISFRVYTRNRLFRLMGSKKYGKPSSAILRIASSCEFVYPGCFCNELFYTSDEVGIVNVLSSKKQLIGKVRLHFKINSRSYSPNLNTYPG